MPTHAKGQMCAVSNYSTDGTTVSGSSIQGVGLSSASSFPLGTVGASAVLLDDGTSWRFLAGQQDSGWVALTSLLAGSIGAFSGTYTPAIRVRGDEARMRGALQNNTGAGWTTGTGTIMGSLAAAFRPASNVQEPGVAWMTTNVAQFQISSAGNLTVLDVWAAGSFLGLDVFGYSLN